MRAEQGGGGVGLGRCGRIEQCSMQGLAAGTARTIAPRQWDNGTGRTAIENGAGGGGCRRLDDSSDVERPGTDTGETDPSICRLDRNVGKPRRRVATDEGARGHEAPMVALQRAKKRRERRSGRRWRAEGGGEAQAQLCVLTGGLADEPAERQWTGQRRNGDVVDKGARSVRLGGE